MRWLAIDALLAAAVCAAWIAALALPRLRTPLDRLHCVSFVLAVCCPAVLVAAAIEDGVTDRLWKIGLVLVVGLTGGAAANHAIARAIHLRGGHDL